MRLTVVLVICALSVSPAAAQDRTPGPGDEAAVRAVVAAYEEARRQQDREAIAVLLTEDADQHTTSSEWRQGRDAVVEGPLGASQRNPGNRTITVDTVRFLTPDVAIADGPYEIPGPAGTGTRQIWTTIVVTRGARGWRIAAIRNKQPT
jgi:uncharacterized protein (TIGR02246 family)